MPCYRAEPRKLSPSGDPQLSKPSSDGTWSTLGGSTKCANGNVRSRTAEQNRTYLGRRISLQMKKSRVVAIALFAAIATLVTFYLQTKSVEKKPDHRVGKDTASALIERPVSIDNSKETINPASAPITALSGTYNKVPKETPGKVEFLIDEALKKDRPADFRAKAVYFSLSCLTIQSLPERSLDDLKMMTGADPETANSVLRESRQAQNRLSDVCGPWINGRLIDRLKQAKLPALGPIGKSLMLRISDNRSQEYTQAVTQLLSNPDIHQIQFDYWLSRDLNDQLINGYKLNASQAILVQDFLYESLATTNGNNDYRIDLRCAMKGICSSNLIVTHQEALKVQEIALQIRNAIQQQRWDILIPKQ
jgi:hypothetical protein